MVVGIGTSAAEDSAAAGHAAAAAALAPLAGAPAALVLVYASVRYELPELLAAIRSVTGDAPVVGATSCGQFHDGQAVPPGTGVAVLAMTAGGYRFGVASASGLRADPVLAGRDLARAAREAAGAAPNSALLLLADGLIGDPQKLLSGAYRVTGASVPVVGGAAGDDRALTRTFVFHDGQALTDAAVAVWIGGEQPFNVTCGHGWRPETLPLPVTEVDGPVIRSIGGRPALELYREYFRADDPAGSEPAGQVPEGYHSAHALGLIEPDGTQLIRGVYLDADGSLRSFNPLPAFCAVQVVSALPDDLLSVSEQIVRQTLDGCDPAVMLTFSCSARFDILGSRYGEEAARLQAAAGAVPTFGFYTYGEFARTSSVAGYHNATIAALAL